VVASTKPLAVGIRLQPGPRRDCLSAGLPRHEEGLRQRELPVRCHVICKAVMSAALAVSKGDGENRVAFCQTRATCCRAQLRRESRSNTQTCVTSPRPAHSSNVPFPQTPLPNLPPNPTLMNAALFPHNMQGYCINQCKTKGRIWHHNQPIRGPDAQSNNRRLTGLGAGSSLAVSCFPNSTALPSA
jgi:hypothetical protein